MARIKLRYGIPNIALPRVVGGEINPADFAGHELVVFFCPSDPAAAAREIEEYRSRAGAFQDRGAWLVGVLSGCLAVRPDPPAGTSHITLARDTEGQGWAAFEALLDVDQRTEEMQGGVFLFDRGGCLNRAWARTGHAQDVLCELRGRT